MHDPISCIVLDDEEIACDLVVHHIARLKEVTLAGAYTNMKEARRHLEEEKIDLLIIDIQMPGCTGIDFVKSLQDPPMVIFITSHNDYAFESYDTDAVDYISKPLTEARFKKAIAKAVKQLEERQKQQSAANDDQAVTAETDYFVIRTESQYVKISYAEVIYIEALSDFVKIFTASQVYITLSNLKNIERSLPASMFIRIHRSYIANLKYIESISSSEVKVNNIQLPLGESYKKNVMDQVIGNRLIKR